MLRSYVLKDQKDWDIWIPSAVFAYGHKDNSIDDWTRGANVKLGNKDWDEYMTLTTRIRQAKANQVQAQTRKAKSNQAK